VRTPRTGRLAAEGALVVAALFYGITFPLVHDALRDITPFAYLLGRFTVATVCVAPFAVFAYRAADAEARRLVLRAGLVAGAFLFAGYATQTVGLQYTTASTSAFITGLNVVFVPVIVAALHRRWPAPPVVIGIAMAVAGLFLLTGAQLDLGRGDLLTLACAVLFALHIVWIGAYVRRVPQSAFSTVQLAVVAVCCVPPAAVQGRGSVTALALVAVVFTGIACSAVALPLQIWGQHRIPPARAALILLSEPVFAAIASYLDGERLDAAQLVGAAVILAGIAISVLAPRGSSLPADVPHLT
jgi:drug/metabolite transporter (DMT)-like permease